MSFYSKIALLLCAIGLLAAGCSNTKTAATRAFHNLTAHYNVIFEAQQSYDKGILAIEDGLKVNYTELLPVWKLDDPQASEIATSYMDACVEECGKNILKHSITSKPNKKYSKTGMSQNDEAFYSKAEYCKWIDDTYLLMTSTALNLLFSLVLHVSNTNRQNLKRCFGWRKLFGRRKITTNPKNFLQNSVKTKDIRKLSIKIFQNFLRIWQSRSDITTRQSNT